MSQPQYPPACFNQSICKRRVEAKSRPACAESGGQRWEGKASRRSERVKSRENEETGWSVNGLMRDGREAAQPTAHGQPTGLRSGKDGRT